MYRLLGCLALVLLLPMSAAAQSASTDERDQAMQEMRARIEKLDKLVAELQKERESRNIVATAQPASEPAPAPTTPIVSPSQHEEIAASMDHSGGQGGATNATERKFPALHFRGFGDVDFAATDDKTTHSGFNMGQFILHVSTPLSEKVTVFGETSFTAQTTPTATVYNVDIERSGDGGDFNNDRAWVANLFARPAALNGLQVGGAVYGDLATPSPGLTGNPQFRELITSAHIVWTKETPEFLAEFAHVRHRNI